VASAIENTHSNITVELATIKTQGDKILDTPLAQIGSKGLFTKEIEEALLDGRVDLAVHSMKDLPTDLPDGLKLSAIMKREDARDVFISRDGRNLEELEAGARIGTSSLRRKAFLLNRLPYLEVISIRGNVDTRLRKMETENLAGVMLAAAGILRMGFGDRVTTFLQPDSMIPAIGQGALAIETRADDPRTADVVTSLNHDDTAQCVQVERAFLRRMGGGCQVPMAAHCVIDGGRLKVTAAVVHPDGTPIIRDTLEGRMGDASTGSKLADTLIERGADTILRSVLDQHWEPGPTTDII
jgi:hydroxymethylbilane synthase